MGNVNTVICVKDFSDAHCQPVITKALYRQLRLKKFKFCCPNINTIKVFGMKFCGTFETSLECNSILLPAVKFYVIDDPQLKQAIVDRNTAKSLKLI